MHGACNVHVQGYLLWDITEVSVFRMAVNERQLRKRAWHAGDTGTLLFVLFITLYYLIVLERGSVLQMFRLF
jgi:hypothetical protein